jgi:hypothetical protein
MAFFIKQNDTSPNLDATLKDASDNAIDLAGASLRFHMRKIGATSAKVDAAATIIDEDTGQVRYTWSAGDTDTIGSFEAEFEVTYGDGSVETFPNNKFFSIEITDDIA